jgi:hypothetical protein
MTTLKIDLDYGRKPEAIAEVNNAELTADYIQFAVNKKHEHLTGSQTRMFARIQRKLDAAIAESKDSVELEISEAEFIRDAFKDAKVPPALAKYFVVLMDEVDNLGKEQ